jgi:hypothetical protein
LLWGDYSDGFAKLIMLFLINWFVNRLLTYREIVEAGAITSIESRPNRSLAESTTAIRAYIMEDCFYAIRAKRALKATDAGVNRVCR